MPKFLDTPAEEMLDLNGERVAKEERIKQTLASGNRLFPTPWEIDTGYSTHHDARK